MVQVDIIKAIFSCLNFKSDEESLPYSMSEVSNKTVHGSQISQFKSVLHSEGSEGSQLRYGALSNCL